MISWKLLFNQLVEDYQSHSGAVDMVTTPKVAYAYADSSLGHVRPTLLVYPNGRVLRYGYNPGTDDALNRVSFLADDDSGTIGPHLAEYAYLGVGQFVQVAYPEPNLRYDLAHGAGDEPYAGLDRFDRIVDLVWRDQTQGVDVERIQHGYDRAGSRLWRETPVATAHGVHLDELYTYDGMNQLVAFARGDLNAAKDGLVPDTKSLAQQWSLDATGNWSNFKNDVDGNGTWDLDQARTHNAVNEISQLAGSAAHMVHDRAGNMIHVPKPDNWAAHYDLVYDAWNRVVSVTDGETPVTEYRYDGRNYRIQQTISSTTRHSYYSHGWQVLEERASSSISADHQFIWGLRYLDDLVVRDRDASSDGVFDERLYTLQDANWNVVAISDATSAIQERVAYTAYGSPRFSTGSFGSRTSSVYDWETLYCGYRWDNHVVSYDVRHRILFPYLGRWNRQDPIGYKGKDFNLYRYVDNLPLTRTDPTGKAVEVCCRPTEFGGLIDSILNASGDEHCWIRTSTIEAGMGPANGGNLPEEGEGGCGTQITDHTGEGNKAISHCHTLPGCNEACVSSLLVIGTNTGNWGPSNNCNTLAVDILKKCDCQNKCHKWGWVTKGAVPGTAMPMCVRECVKKDVPSLPLF